jgi:hypothetical protein
MLQHTKKHHVSKVEKVSLSRTCHFCKKKGHIRPFCYRLFGLPQQVQQKEHRSRRRTVRKVWKPKRYNVGLMAHISQKTLSKERWYFDSGCSLHMTGSKDLLNIEKSCGDSYVTFGNQTRGKILGTCRLISPESPELDSVLLVKGLTTNLISISQLCDHGMSVNFSKFTCCVIDRKGKVIMNGIKSEGDCYLWIPPCKDQTQFDQVLSLRNSKCMSQSRCEDKFPLAGNRLSRHMRLEKELSKCYVEQDVPTLCCINLCTSLCEDLKCNSDILCQ